jgi:hypothetical protein
VNAVDHRAPDATPAASEALDSYPRDDMPAWCGDPLRRPRRRTLARLPLGVELCRDRRPVLSRVSRHTGDERHPHGARKDSQPRSGIRVDSSRDPSIEFPTDDGNNVNCPAGTILKRKRILRRRVG